MNTLFYSLWWSLFTCFTVATPVHVIYSISMMVYVLCLFPSLENGSGVSRELLKLMKIPVDNYNDVLMVLKLEHFGPMFEYFDYHARKTMSMYLVTNALECETKPTTQEQVGGGD